MKKVFNILSRGIFVLSVCIITGCNYAGSTDSSVSGGKTYTASIRGGLVGYSTQIQGSVVKNGSWLDSQTGNIKLSGMNTPINKTSEVIAVPEGTVATITIPDDSSWNEYYVDRSSSLDFGVYLKNRNVKLDPFVMSQYEVTQNLYEAVTNNNPSGGKGPGDYAADQNEIQGNRPVECITWYEACAFCNELTIKTMGDSECVYYNKNGDVYDFDDAVQIIESDREVFIFEKSYDLITHKWLKKGYRLPTEAEWEFCARGGDPNAKDIFGDYIWNYAYPGVQTEYPPSAFGSGPDAKVTEVAWCGYNAKNISHEVGLKRKNNLNIYDMCGNVCEMCYDLCSHSAKKDDSQYFNNENNYIENPLGDLSGDARIMRGGSFTAFSYVSVHYCNQMSRFSSDRGVRLVRSIL